MDFYYHGAWRMDWGFGNPNKTAALIACLMIAVWTIAHWWRRGFWFALPIFTALGWCLVQTYSRGGILALLAGVGVLLAWTPRPWPRPKAFAVMAALWVIGLSILYAKAETRYGQGLFSEDQSIDSRLVVWKHFPEMLAAAQWGWGNAGDAYTQWFQPTGQSVNYLNLLNSHFTCMAEGGWAFSMFYVGGWMLIVLLCWPVQGARVGAVPLAVWVAFGVAGFFSQVEDALWLWVVPLALLAFAGDSRRRLKVWPGLRSFGMAGLSSIGAVAILVLVGWSTTVLPIRKEGRATVLGLGVNRTVIFIDRGVMGKLYGHTLRRFMAESGADISQRTYIVTESADYLIPTGVAQAILSGKMVHEVSGVSHCKQVVLINPACFPEEMQWKTNSASQPCVYFGEYSQSPSRSSWETWPKVRYVVIDGAGDFVPGWPGALWKPAGT